MANIEKLSQTAMEIITYAGLAKSNYMTALRTYKEGNEEEARNLLQEGAVHFSNAHKCHSNLLTEEMTSLEPQVSLLLVHAEDQLMGSENIKILVEEIIDVYKERRN
jgi:cellobiose PTS system EIIA component